MPNADIRPITNRIYSGLVKHQRYVDAGHAFEYRMFALWLSVFEVDQPQKKWPGIGRSRFGVVTVRAEDYMAHRPEQNLKSRLQGQIKQKLGKDWDGEAFLLAQPRYFGFIMNPLSLYYCYSSDYRLEFVIGEITNTPWSERYCYVFDMTIDVGDRPRKFSFDKEFHVSPFLPMNMQYTWMLSVPGERIDVGIWNRMDGKVKFEAHMGLNQVSLSLSNIIKYNIKMPLMTWKIWFGIYFNAAILYAIKRVTFYTHPKKI